MKQKKSLDSGEQKTNAVDNIEKGYANDCRIPKRFINSSLKNIKNDTSTCDIRNINTAIEFTKNIRANVSKGLGLLLIGGVGTMKTSTAVAILKHYYNLERGGSMLNMCDLVSEIFSYSKGADWAKREHYLKTCRLLVVDDLGGENTASDWVISKVDEIFNARYNNNLSTIVTSNCSLETLAEIYTPRMVDRIRATSLVLEYHGESKRKNVTFEMVCDYTNQTELNF